MYMTTMTTLLRVEAGCPEWLAEALDSFQFHVIENVNFSSVLLTISVRLNHSF
jgi:hypothetical protein